MNWTQDSWSRQENVIVDRPVGSSSPARTGSTSTSSGRTGSILGRHGRAAAGRRRTGSRCGRGSRPTTARRWRTGSRSGSARRSGASGSPRRVISSGPILGTLAEVCSDGKVDVAGVVDDTQVDGVLYQWRMNGNCELEGPGAAPLPRGRPVRRQAVDEVGARHGARLHAREDHGRRRHLVHRQLQPLALGRDERRERARDPRRRARRPAGRVRGRDPRALPAGDAAGGQDSPGQRHLHFCESDSHSLCLGVLALGVAVASAARLPQAPACAVFPATSAWNQRVDKLPVVPNSDRDRRRDRRRRPRPRRLRLRALGRRADRDPDHGRPRHAGEVARPVRVRVRVGQGAVPDPGERRDRGRPRARTATGTR